MGVTDGFAHRWAKLSIRAGNEHLPAIGFIRSILSTW